MSADQTELYRDAFAAIHEALNVPPAAIGGGHDRTRANLLDSRADAARCAAASLVVCAGYPGLVCEEIDRLRQRIGQLPVTYARFMLTADDRPADCMICGPGCCSPVLGTHGSRPGPRAGASVVSA